MVVSLSVVCPPNHMNDGELQLAATLQHHENLSFSTSLAQEKTRIQGTVSTECVLLWHHHKVQS